MSRPRKNSKPTAYVVYLLLCKNGALYTGITTDVKRRFAEHKSGKGAHYTRVFGAVKILYKEKVKSRVAAQKREHEIKQWNAARKWILAKSCHGSFHGDQKGGQHRLPAQKSN